MRGIPFQQYYLVADASFIFTTGINDNLRGGTNCRVGDWKRQLEWCWIKFDGIVFFQVQVEFIIIFPFATKPGHAIGEIGATSYEQYIFMNTGNRTGNPECLYLPAPRR